MMTKALHQIAKSDTPSTVDVPESVFSLFVWAVGRFGGIVVATAFLAYAWNESNQAHRQQTERLILLLENKSATETQLAMALRELSQAVDGLKEEAKLSHLRARGQIAQ